MNVLISQTSSPVETEVTVKLRVVSVDWNVRHKFALDVGLDSLMVHCTGEIFRLRESGAMYD